MGISKLFYKDTYISLVKREECFVLSVRYADQPTALADGLRRWPEIEPIERYFNRDDAQEAEIPIDELDELLETLSELEAKCARNRKLIFYVQSEVQRACVQSVAPPEFCLTYRWEKNKLRRVVPDGVIELPDGWYRQGDVYWSYPGLSEIDRQRIRRNTIEKHALLEFLQRDLTACAAAGVRYTCELHHDTIPALELAIESVEVDVVQIRRKWNAPPEHIDSDFDLDGYVVAGRTLRPGLRPGILAEHLTFEGEVATLNGREIARFLDVHYPMLKPWIIGGAQRFEEAHMFVKPPYEWNLVTDASPIRGVGRASAQPVARIGGAEFTVQALTQMMQMPYARIDAGWVRRVDLYTLGIDARGKWTGKGSLKPMRLSPTQVVCQGDARLNGPWSRMEMRGVSFCSSAAKQRAAREHLAYLLHWGIPGGIVGGYESAAIYGVELLNSLFTADAQARVLVVGDKADIEEFLSLSGSYQALPAQQFEENRASTVYCVAFDKLGRTPAIRGISWDLLLLIEPDVLYASDKKAALEDVGQVEAALRIGFYTREFSAWSQEMVGLQKIVLKLDAEAAVIKCLIQNPRAITPLPQPFVFSPLTPIPASDSGFEVVLTGEAAKGSPIPPREQDPHVKTSVMGGEHLASGRAAQSIQSVVVNRNASNEGFIREARKLAWLGGAAHAQHIPFSCYWPKYSDMNVAQRNWYFHLRGRIRRGEYPDTDLSYLFVRIYELINLIGCENAASAYQELMNIWIHYRDRYPRLDKSLDDWMFDFFCVQKSGVDAWTHGQNAPALTPSALNTALSQRDINESLLLTVPALELISDYRIRQSKFYLSGHGALLEKALPLVIAFVDANLCDKDVRGLRAAFIMAPVTEQRVAFQGAIVERTTEYALTYSPYCACQSLKELIGQMIRYTENALRTQLGFGAKLRGVVLDKPYIDLIETYIARQFARKSEASPIARVSLDTQAIERLRSESDEVREALIASVAQQEEALAASMIETPNRPPDAPEGLLTDLEPVNRILHALTEDQRRMIAYFHLNGWEQDAQQYTKAFPTLFMEAELDAINVHAVRFLGTQMVVREGSLFAVADDYRDELEYLIQHPKEQQACDWAVDWEGLDPEWVEFFRAADLDALGAALSGSGELARLASERGDMPDLITDALNAAAMETVGDLIVDGNAIIDEYRPLIEAHLRRE